MLTTHSLGFLGEHGDNGIIDCTVNNLDLMISNVQKGFYPKSYTGTFNAIGQLGLKIKETNYNLLGGKVPTKFEGVISFKGDSVFIETKDSYMEFGGHQYVHSLQGKIKFSSNNEQIEFLHNREKLKKMISNYRLSIGG